MLLLSLLTLFAGPLIYQWINRGGFLARVIDRLIVIALIVLLAVLLVPEVVRELGGWAVLLMLAGYLLPNLLESVIRRAAVRLHLASLAIALIGLLAHEMFDGAALATSTLAGSPALGLAIVLHRFGVGLLLWMIMEPAFGSAKAWAMLIAMAAATVFGYAFSERLLPLAGADLLIGFQAVIIGTIGHSLVHRGHVHAPQLVPADASAAQRLATSAEVSADE